MGDLLGVGEFCLTYTSNYIFLFNTVNLISDSVY